MTLSLLLPFGTPAVNFLVRYKFNDYICSSQKLVKFYAVLSFFKETSLKKTITVGGGVNINDIYYTIFSKVLCFQLCSHSSPPKRTPLGKSVLRALVLCLLHFCVIANCTEMTI